MQPALPSSPGHVGVSDGKSPAPAAGWNPDSLQSSQTSVGRNRAHEKNNTAINTNGDKKDWWGFFVLLKYIMCSRGR